MKTQQEKSGFAALICILIISCMLLVAAVRGGRHGLEARELLLLSEYKLESLSLARSCLNFALLELAYDENYAGNETKLVGEETCTIRKTFVEQESTIIETTGNVGRAVTNLETWVNAKTLDIQKSLEVQGF